MQLLGGWRAGLVALSIVVLDPGGAHAATADDFVTGGTVTSGWCERSRGTSTETHPGTDIGKKDASGRWVGGSTVKAGVNGTVVKVYQFDGTHHTGSGTSNSDWFQNFNMVVVKTNTTPPQFYVYAHCASISVAEGANVTPNTAIGTMGGYGTNCANTFGPHVHIEVRTDQGGDGQWGAAEENSARSGSKTNAVDLALTVGANKETSAFKTSGGLPGAIEYTVENAPIGEMPIYSFRVTNECEEPYVVVTSPTGWLASTWEETPHAIEWWATDGAEIWPGMSQAGFVVDSPCPEYPVFWSTGPDDATVGIWDDLENYPTIPGPGLDPTSVRPPDPEESTWGRMKAGYR